MLLLQELINDSAVVPEKLGKKYYHWFLDFKMFLRQNHGEHSSQNNVTPITVHQS